MTNGLHNSADSRNKLMKEALELQGDWERTLNGITRGREFEDLTLEEQNEWKRVSALFNEQIDSKLREWERN